MTVLVFGWLIRGTILFSLSWTLFFIPACRRPDQPNRTYCREEVEPLVAIARRIDRAPPQEGLDSAVIQREVDQAIGLIHNDPCFATAEAKASAFLAELLIFFRGRLAATTFPWETPVCCEPSMTPPDVLDRVNRAGTILHLVENTLDRKLADKGNLTFLVQEIFPPECRADSDPTCRWRSGILFRKTFTHNELERVEEIYFATSSTHKRLFILNALEQAKIEKVPSWLLRQSLVSYDGWNIEQRAKTAVRNNIDEQLLRRLLEHQSYFVSEESKLKVVEYLTRAAKDGGRDDLREMVVRTLKQVASDPDQSKRVREAASQF